MIAFAPNSKSRQMRLRIELPNEAQVTASGFIVPVAARGMTWSSSCLQDYARRSGVYVLHSAGEVLYVGKTTDGDFGNFGERLRRHFHGPSASDGRTHRLLAAQATPIRAYLLDLDAIDAIVIVEDGMLTRERKALVMEQVLIGLLTPRGNLH